MPILWQEATNIAAGKWTISCCLDSSPRVCAAEPKVTHRLKRKVIEIWNTRA